MSTMGSDTPGSAANSPENSKEQPSSDTDESAEQGAGEPISIERSNGSAGSAAGDVSSETVGMEYRALEDLQAEREAA